MMFNQTVTRLRAPTTVDRTNDTIYDWAAADETPIIGLSVQPQLQGSAEMLNGRDATKATWRVSSAPGFDLDLLATDRVRLSTGEICEVDGDIVRWPSPHGPGVHHADANLRRVEG